MSNLPPGHTAKAQGPQHAAKPARPEPAHPEVPQPATPETQSLLQRAQEDPLGLTQGDLQRLGATVGREAVQRVLDSDAVVAARQEAARSNPPSAEFQPLPGIQAKLVVGPVNDVYEQEADAVAEQVMRMAEPAPDAPGVRTLQRQEDEGEEDEEEESLQAKPLADTISPLVQRATETVPGALAKLQRHAGHGGLLADSEEHVQGHVQRQEEDEEEDEGEESLQSKPTLQRQAGGSFDTDSDFEQRVHASRGSGSPLPPSLRKGFEAKFGADFGGVRVHTGGEAADLNQRVQARAFTVGSDIHFGAGQYDPHSTAGQSLLAHELTHTIQQGAVHRSVQPTRLKVVREGFPAMQRGAVQRSTGFAYLQREGDPFAPFTNKAKGTHDYILVPDFDPAPKGYKDYVHPANGSKWYQKLSDNSFTQEVHIELSRGMLPSHESRFRTAIIELQTKLFNVMGNNLGNFASIRRKLFNMEKSSGHIGSQTERLLKRFQGTKGMAKTGVADYKTWEELDTAGSGGVKEGQVSYRWDENLTEFAFPLGMQSQYSWKATDKEFLVTVVINFSGPAAGEAASVGGIIEGYWNRFKIAYKKEGAGRKPPKKKPADLKLTFNVAKPGKKGKVTLHADNDVLLWRGDHPNWAGRGLNTVQDKKTRSDAGNWRLGDNGGAGFADHVKNMFGHEFGHLLGLEDEYSRTHKDIKRLSGETALAYDKGTETMKKPIQARYDQLKNAVQGANSYAGVKLANKDFAELLKDRSLAQFIMEEYKLKTGNKLSDIFKQKVIDSKNRALTQPAASAYVTKVVNAHKAKHGGIGPMAGQALKQAKQDFAADIMKEWDGPPHHAFPNPNTPSLWWPWYEKDHSFSSGGLMGDYTLLTTKKAEDRPNAVAHEHAHPLEPRHVRRFAEYVSRYSGDVWEAAYR